MALSVVQANPGSLQMGGGVSGGSLQGSVVNLQPTASPQGNTVNPQSTASPTVSSLGSNSGGSIPGTPIITSSSGGGSVPVATPGMAQFLAASNLGVKQLQGQEGTIPAFQAVANSDVGNVANNKLQTLQDQYNEGQAANKASQVNLNQNNAFSLAQLGSQLRALYQQTMDALGAQGAGNSSAASLLSTGLSQEANAGRESIDTQRAQQQTGINQNASNLTANYADQVGAVNAWKKQTLDQLASQYATQKQNILNEIASAKTDQTRMGLYMRDQQAANTALAQMKQIIDTAGSAIAQLNQSYTQATPSTAQVPGLSAFDNGYQTQQFVVPAMPGLTYGQNASPASVTSMAPIPAQVTNTGTNLPGTVQSLSTP